MKGTLIKVNGSYLLRTPLITEEKLSLKNCQAIERGYDLDELAGNYTRSKEFGTRDTFEAYEAGFQKALELMSDKKFTEDDIKEAILFGDGIDWWDEDCNPMINYIQSLQQTEWEVEICCYVEEDNDSDTFNSPMLTSTGEPKLDADGCLILKRVL